MELINQTLQLKKHLDELKELYEQNNPPDSLSNNEFFLNMKKETAEIYNLIEDWEEGALAFVKDRKVNVHPHQIVSTRENLELLLLHSYYIDAKRKRYMELNHSCHYIFDQLVNEIEIKKSEGSDLK